jgi:hypothetical protein
VATPPPGPSRRPLGAALLTLGLSLWTLAVWGLGRDVAWIAQPFYAFAWWGHILTLDGLCLLKRGHSLLSRARGLVFPLALWSITFWVFFELLNVRFQNWYYVGVWPLRDGLDAARIGLFVTLSFATVFIGIFETYDALAALGAFRRRRLRRTRQLPPWTSHLLQLLGLAMAASALAFPTYLAPLIWGSFTFLVDPLNYRRGARSLLRDIEAGDWGLIARLFLAGLLAGVVWESLNYLAPQKWIYTVRGLERLKLFEMPLLGFLGFPGLAYDCLAAFALVSSIFHGNRLWESHADLAYAHVERAPSRPRRWLFRSTIPLHLLLWGVVAMLSGGTNVGSFELRLIDLGIAAEQRAELAGAGIERPRQLLRAARDRPRRERLRQIFEGDRPLREALRRAQLYDFKGIGAYYGFLLERLGVERAEQLRGLDAEELHRRLQHLGGELGMQPPRLDMVRVWVLAASPEVIR